MPGIGSIISSAMVAAIGTGEMGIMRTVTVITLAFQNVRDAPSSDAQNVTESRKPCEVPSCPSFPQDALVVGCHEFQKERPASSDIESLVTPGAAPWIRFQYERLG